MATMRQNFTAMPGILKFLAVAGLCVGLAIATTLLPDHGIRVAGRLISWSDWWSSGAGASMLVVGALFVSSVVMMLRRSHHSRLAYVVSCVAIGIAVPYVVAVSGGVAASVSTLSLTYDCLQTLAIALY